MFVEVGEDMKILTDREYRERIRDAQEEIRLQYNIHDDYRNLLDRVLNLEHEVYELKNKKA